MEPVTHSVREEPASGTAAVPRSTVSLEDGSRTVPHARESTPPRQWAAGRVQPALGDPQHRENPHSGQTVSVPSW